MKRSGGDPESFELSMCSCKAVRTEFPASRVLDIMRDNRCTFMRVMPDRIDPNPERFISKSGSIVVPTKFTHPSLGRDALAISRGWRAGKGEVAFIRDTMAVIVHQTIDVKSVGLEEIAAGLLEMARVLSPRLRPAYGWMDEPRDDILDREFESFSEVEHWFYGNLFGAEIAGQVDPRFFSELPAARVERLEGGAVLVVSSPTYRDWLQDPPPGLAAHLRKFAPHVHIFRP